MPFKIKETILGISIAVIFVFFVVFGIKAFYKEPKYEDFCKGQLYPEKPYPYREPSKESNFSLCNKIEVANYEFAKQCSEKSGDVVYAPDENGCNVAKECSLCGKNFRDTMNVYNRNVFIISGIVGIIVIVIGAVLHLTSVSAGLFGGGVLTIIYGTTNYWSELADYARFIILGIALAVLIYLGYKGFSVLGFGKKE